MPTPITRWSTVRLNAVGEKLAEIMSYYPKPGEIYITSGMDGDHGSASYHYANINYGGSPAAAIDIGFGGTGFPARGRDVAKWLYDLFWNLIVEEIHTTPFSDDQGFYVKNQVRYPGGGPYAGATAAAHRDHVHFATSSALADKILVQLRGSAPAAPAPTPTDNLIGRPWPSYMAPGNYFGLITGPATSHGGYYANERPDVQAIQVRLQQLKYAPTTAGWADGKFEQPTADAVAAWQRDHMPGTQFYGQVWSDDWAVLFSAQQPAPAPVPVPNPVPSTGAIFGVDLSDFDSDRGNSPATVAKYRAEGISFVTHKTCEVGDSKVTYHTKIGVMLTAARDAGVPFLGGYLVVRSGHSTAVQVAEHFKTLDQYVPWWRTFPGFFHQIDLEHWSYDIVPADIGNACAEAIATQSGQPVVMYASKGQYGNSTLATPRWNANYPNVASGPYRDMYVKAGGNSGPGWVAYGSPSVLPVLWQYASDAVVAGVSPTDISAFRGSEDDFKRVLGFKDPVPTPPPVVQPPAPTPAPAPEVVLAEPTAVNGGAFLFKEASTATVYISNGVEYKTVGVTWEQVPLLVYTGIVSKPLSGAPVSGADFPANWVLVVPDGAKDAFGGKAV